MTPGPRVAVIVSRFPKVTETFIARELTELERNGLRVDLYALVRQDVPFVQDEARAWVARCRYGSLRAVVHAHLWWLRRAPGRLARAWWTALLGNWRDRAFLLRSLAVVPTAAAFARQIARDGDVHVHAHWATHATLAAVVVEILTGVPYSFTGHAHDVYVSHHMLEDKIERAASIIVCSRYNAELLAARYGAQARDKTRVIRHGLDLDVYPPTPVPAGEGTLRICVVASFNPFKGHSHLLDACRLLCDRGLDVRCTLVGDGQRRPAAERQAAALGLGEHVRFAGSVPSSEVREVMRASHVVVHPSVVAPSGKKDGVPNVLVEALALARPVVASDLDGIRELIDDGVHGLLVASGDATALADAVQAVHEHPEDAAARARRGRRRVVEEYDARRNGRALYDELVHAISMAGRR